MGDSISTAFTILLVGMITVFFILSLVVITGNTIIRVVNYFSPERLIVTEKSISTSLPPQKSPSQISGPKLAAIVSAVEIITKGEGNIERIEKID